MTQINLLPWRQQIRKTRLIRFILLSSASAITGLAIILITHSIIATSNDNQLLRNQYLQSQLDNEGGIII